MSPRKKITRGVHYFRSHPNSLLRLVVGVLLILCGIAGVILPILGVWLIPLGIFLLAVDFPWAHRLHVRLSGYWQVFIEKLQSWRNKPGGKTGGPFD